MSGPAGSEGGEVCGGAVTPGRGAGGAPGMGREEPGIRSFLTAMARPPAGAGAPAVLASLWPAVCPLAPFSPSPSLSLSLSLSLEESEELESLEEPLPSLSPFLGAGAGAPR